MQKILIVVLSLTSLCFQCGADANGHAKITVIDQDHNPVPGATVTFEEHSSNIVGSGSCDANGVYIYDQANPIEEILEVVVDSPDDLHHGAGIIRIKPDETTELTIMID